MNTPIAQVLLQHGQFVQSLARRLLRDAHLAEDVAQETWARYAERAPSAPGSLRHWLRTVTRNLAANVRRREASRTRSEERAARPEALPAVSEGLTRGECLRRVIEAVLALDEPYRTTILARYYQGQEAQRIADESATPVATVRSREQRALKLLRERLERELGGERSAWAVALARLLQPGAEVVSLPAGPLAAGGLVKAAWIAVGVAAVGVAWLAVGRYAGGPAPVAPEVVEASPTVPAEPAVPALAPGSAPATRLAAVRSPEPGRVGTSPARTSSTSSSGSSAALQAGLAELRGRFVLPGGAPAAGVAIGVHGWGANEARELQYGEPETWQDPSTTTDADGRFTLRFDPPRAYQFALDASLPGRAGASWRWHELRPGTTTDLGEVELPLGGIVEGRVVDRAGQEVPGDWRVYADSIGLGRREGREETGVSAAVEPGTARFRLVDVWPGPNELKAYSRMANWTRGQRIVAVAGEVVTADIVYSGPDNSRRITVTTSSRPFHVMGDPGAGALRLCAPGLAPRTARRIEDSASGYSFDDLPPGAYALELDDPRYLPWRQDGVSPGTAVSARLEGSSALALDVRGPDGEPVERYEVRVAFRNVNFFPREFRVHEGGEPLPGGIVHGMFAGDYTVTVLAEGLGSASAEVDGLAPAETRTLRLELGIPSAQAGTVAGRVVHADGTPVAGAEVVLLAPAEIDDSPASPVLRSNTFTGDPQRWRKELRVTVSDATGAFSFDLSRPGSHALQAAFGPVLSVSSQRFDVPPDGEGAALELVLARGGRLQGRLLGPADADFSGLRIWAVPAIADFSGVGFDPSRETMVEASADGTYAIGPLPEGTYRVFLLLPETAGELVMRSQDHVAGGLELGSVQVREGELVPADFEASGRLPGEVTLTVMVNGSPVSSVDVTLRPIDPQDPTQLRSVTDASGTARPKAFPGLYRAYVRDGQAGWSAWCAEEVLVSAAASTRQTLVVGTARGTLTCVGADGLPLAEETVTVLRASEAPSPWEQVTTRQTDGDGRLELLLAPGEYALQRGGFRPFDHPATVPLSWTSDGPRDTRVPL